MRSSKISSKITLEQEYEFEHKQRIKAEAYIQEVWEFNQELTKEVMRLQKIISEGKLKKEINSPLNDKIKLQMRLKQIFSEREKSILKMQRKLHENKS